MLKDLIELIEFMYSDLTIEEKERMKKYYASNINEYKELKKDCILLSIAA